MPGKEVKLSTLLHLPEVSSRENLITYKRRRVSNKSPQCREAHAVSELGSSGTKLVATEDGNGTDVQYTEFSRVKEDAVRKWTTRRKGRDAGWAYGKMIGGNRQHWQCNWCGLTRYGGGVTRLKRHIAGDLDVQQCPKAPDHVVQHVRSILMESDTKMKMKNKMVNDEEENKDSCKKNISRESWRCVLENMLKMSDECGSGGIQTSIRGVLSFLDGKPQVGTRNMTKCGRALRDILSNDKFGLLCTLLCTNFGDGKGQNGFYLDFSQINTFMKEGKYEGSSEMFHQDIQKVWDKFQRIGQEMVDLATSLSHLSTAAVENKIEPTELGNSSKDPAVRLAMPEKKIASKSNNARKLISSDSNPTLDQDELEPSQNDMRDGKSSCTCRYCNLPIGEWEHIRCTGCYLTYHLACVNPFTEDNTVDWYCSDCVREPIQAPTEEEDDLVSEIDARKSPENPVRTDQSKVCKICKGPEESGEAIMMCSREKCPHKYYHKKCLKESQTPNAAEADKQCWYCPTCFCHNCLSSKDDYFLVSCSGCDNGYHIYCIKLPQDRVKIDKWYCNNCIKDRENKLDDTSKTYEPMRMLMCALESLED